MEYLKLLRKKEIQAYSVEMFGNQLFIHLRYSLTGEGRRYCYAFFPLVRPVARLLFFRFCLRGVRSFTMRDTLKMGIWITVFYRESEAPLPAVGYFLRRMNHEQKVLKWEGLVLHTVTKPPFAYEHPRLKEFRQCCHSHYASRAVTGGRVGRLRSSLSCLCPVWCHFQSRWRKIRT